MLHQQQISRYRRGRTPTVGRRSHEILSSEDGQDIAEYGVLLVLILVIVIGAVRLVGENANGTFSRVADDLQHLQAEGDGD
jgi:Flp pilus assembly pilin Flp